MISNFFDNANIILLKLSVLIFKLIRYSLFSLISYILAIWSIIYMLNINNSQLISWLFVYLMVYILWVPNIILGIFLYCYKKFSYINGSWVIGFIHPFVTILSLIIWSSIIYICESYINIKCSYFENLSSINSILLLTIPAQTFSAILLYFLRKLWSLKILK